MRTDLVQILNTVMDRRAAIAVGGAAIAGAATAAAEPPLLPPGVRETSHGFFVEPPAEFSVDEPIANSSQLSLPSDTAPALASRSTTVASNGLA